jgi:hypothetical protein
VPAGCGRLHAGLCAARQRCAHPVRSAGHAVLVGWTPGLAWLCGALPARCVSLHTAGATPRRRTTHLRNTSHLVSFLRRRDGSGSAAARPARVRDAGPKEPLHLRVPPVLKRVVLSLARLGGSRACMVLRLTDYISWAGRILAENNSHPPCCPERPACSTHICARRTAAPPRRRPSGVPSRRTAVLSLSPRATSADRPGGCLLRCRAAG